MNLEKFFVPELTDRMQQTIATLRRMRFAGTSKQTGESLVLPEIVLEDAEILALTASHILIDDVFSEQENLSVWDESLLRATKKYGHFEMTPSEKDPEVLAGNRNTVKAGASLTMQGISGFFYELTECGRDAHDYIPGRFRSNNVNGLCLEQLTKGVGILSPLSVDYLSASCFAEAVGQYYHVASPPVQPVLLDANKQEVCSFTDKTVARFRNCNRIITQLDVVTYGSATLKTLDRIGLRLYPNLYVAQSRE